MPASLSNEQKSEVVASLRRFFTEELDQDLSEMRAAFVLDYILTEIAPVAYNQGVEDARKYLASAAEDLPGVCFEEALTYWKRQGGGREIRRKPKD
jgi:uncharacterized protein (DUF2164 family)